MLIHIFKDIFNGYECEVQYAYGNVFGSELVCAFVYRDVLLYIFVVIHIQKYINEQSKTKVMSATATGWPVVQYAHGFHLQCTITECKLICSHES